jgi:hypothetical protein
VCSSPNVPSTSQHGNSSDVHVPSMHDRGFAVVPSQLDKETSNAARDKRHMNR